MKSTLSRNAINFFWSRRNRWICRHFSKYVSQRDRQPQGLPVSLLQFQVGEIIACEEVKKSKKLLCSQVRIGSQVKQIVSGIRKHYSPEEMVGKKVMVLVNLKPASLRQLSI